MSRPGRHCRVYADRPAVCEAYLCRDVQIGLKKACNGCGDCCTSIAFPIPPVPDARRFYELHGLKTILEQGMLMTELQRPCDAYSPLDLGDG